MSNFASNESTNASCEGASVLSLDQESIVSPEETPKQPAAPTDEQVLDVLHDDAPMVETEAFELKQSILTVEELEGLAPDYLPPNWFSVHQFNREHSNKDDRLVVICEDRIKSEQEYLEQGITSISGNGLYVMNKHRRNPAEPKYQAAIVSDQVVRHFVNRNEASQLDFMNTPKVSTAAAMAIELKKQGPDDDTGRYFDKLIPKDRNGVAFWCREVCSGVTMGREIHGSGNEVIMADLALVVILFPDGRIRIDALHAGRRFDNNDITLVPEYMIIDLGKRSERENAR
jgi:hypothetical protein